MTGHVCIDNLLRAWRLMVCSTLDFESHLGMNRMGMDRVGGPGSSALAIQISQAS